MKVSVFQGGKNRALGEIEHLSGIKKYENERIGFNKVKSGHIFFKRKILHINQLLLALNGSNILLGRGSERAFVECLGVSNVFPGGA